MSDRKKIFIPDDMLETAMEEWRNGKNSDIPSRLVGHILEAALHWLKDELLHEKNVDFHKAILDRGSERYADDMTQRVAFEFGASFARHYLSRLFSLNPEVPEEIRDYIVPDTDDVAGDVYNARLVDAFNRGRKAVI